jgi:prolyl 4-hydroxylase
MTTMNNQTLPLNLHHSIPSDWQQWLKHNLARKVPEASLVNTMVKANFAKQQVHDLIAAIQNQSEERSKAGASIPTGLPQPSPLEGDWQQWLTANVERGVLEQALVESTQCDIRAAWTKRTAELREQSEAQGYTYEAAPLPASGSVQTANQKIPILMAIDKPRIVLFGHVLSKEECEAIIAMAQPRMAPSQTRDNATAQLVVTKQRRSQGTFLQRGQTELVKQLEQRIADLSQWPVDKGEGLQILNYQTGGEYEPHFDFFPPEQPGSQVSLKLGGQRVCTLIVYLNTVEEGGETVFPKLNLKFKAVQGNALYFSYANSKNEIDRMTLHGGAPVTQGEKWIMTKWMRQNPI